MIPRVWEKSNEAMASLKIFEHAYLSGGQPTAPLPLQVVGARVGGDGWLNFDL